MKRLVENFFEFFRLLLLLLVRATNNESKYELRDNLIATLEAIGVVR